MRGLLDKFNPWQERQAIEQQVKDGFNVETPDIGVDLEGIDIGPGPEDETMRVSQERKVEQLKFQQEREQALQDLRQKRLDRWQKYHQERVVTPPELVEKDFLDKEGNEVNFLQAQNWDELVEMIRSQKSITNNNNLELPPEKIINMMYKLAYQHFDNFDKKDWTNITLRHGLRQAVAEHIYKYQQTAEFQALKGLDLSAVYDMENLFAMLRSHPITPEASLIGFNPEEYIQKIQQGKIDDLPDPIKNKVIEINKAKEDNKVKEQNVFQKIGKGFGKLAFWRK